MATSSDHGGPTDVAGSAQIAHGSSIAHPPTSIQRLPNELVATVFAVGAKTTFNSDSGLPFIIAVSHVCRHWRDIAHSTSDAWCCIPVHATRHATTELFLTRSEGRLLDICFYVYGNGSSNDVEETMRLVIPSAPRWSRLYIRGILDTPSERTLQRLVKTLTGLRGVGHLRAFDVQFDEQHNFQTRLPTNLLGTPSPKLESLRFVGAIVRYHSPIFHGLTRLTLANLSQPSYAEFREICTQSPHLQYLKLENVFPGGYAVPQGPFVLKSLRTLDVVMDLEPPYEIFPGTFFRELSMPALCELSLQSERQLVWKSLWYVIQEEDDLVWSHLRTLHFVVSGPVNFIRFIGNSVTLFRTFPKLEHLTFDAVEYGSVHSFLHRWIYSMGAHASPHETWRQLKSLTVRVSQNDSESADQKIVKESLDLLERLRLWIGQDFKLYVW